MNGWGNMGLYETMILITTIFLIILLFTTRSEGFDQNDENQYETGNYPGDTFFTYQNTNNYLRVAEFTEMVNRIKQIIAETLQDLGKQCQGINGTEYDRLAENQITLSCHNDVGQIEEQIILGITRYVIGHIQNKFGININPYQIIGDMMTHLNLLESTVYPLMY